VTRRADVAIARMNCGDEENPAVCFISENENTKAKNKRRKKQNKNRNENAIPQSRPKPQRDGNQKLGWKTL
jgi:hypothetical protein